MMPHTSTAASRRAAIVSIGIKWALVLLVILNLLQLNLLHFSSSGSTRCILKAALATRARSGAAVVTPAAPVLPGSPLGSSEQLGMTVSTYVQKTRSGRYALFVIYTWNYEMLLTAVRSYVAAGFGKSLIILDNSSNSTLLGDPGIAELAAEVIPTRTRLTFSQAQNFLADVAIERGYEYYFWGHSDVAVLGQDESTSFADDVIACVESSFKSRPNWGIIYFNYDWFSAIRTDLVRQVKYDTFVTVYMSDCDFYPRVRAAGFETLNYPEMCPSTKVEVYDINYPLDVPWKDFKRAKTMLDNHRSLGGNRFEWKMDAMALGEKVGWDLWERSSYLYLLAKWGPRQEGQPPCRIEVEEPITGNMTLPQKPFSNLAYLQRFWVQEDPFYDMVPILAGLGRRVEMAADQAAADSEAATGSPAGSVLADGLSILQPGDDVEVISDTDDGVEQLQAASLGVAALEDRVAASQALTQPGASRPQEPDGAAKKDALRRNAAEEVGGALETGQNSSVESLEDGGIASGDPLEDEELIEYFSVPEEDKDRDQEASGGDAQLGQSMEPNQKRRADEPTVISLDNDVAASENPEELYPAETRAGVWDSLDQEKGSAAEEANAQADQEAQDRRGVHPGRKSQKLPTAERTQADSQRDSSRLDEADVQLEEDGEPEQDAGLDKLQDSEDVNGPGQDDLYSTTYYQGSELSPQQREGSDYEDDYDAEYADQLIDDNVEQDFTDLPEDSLAEEAVLGDSSGAEDVEDSRGTNTGTTRVKSGVQAGTRSQAAGVAEGGEGAESGRRSNARRGAGGDLGGLQEDMSAGGGRVNEAADEDMMAADEAISAAEEDFGPVDEQGLEDWDGEEELSDPADLGLDDIDLGDELDDEGGLEDLESEEGISKEEEPDLLEEGSADQ